MKRNIAAALLLLLLTRVAFAAELGIAPTQNPDAPYRLFNTQNIYTLLKLDTRSGQLWQVQWGDKEHRLVDPINDTPLAPGGKPGRFTLYATSNIYTFILLDQEAGDAWYVQWGKPGERFLVHIDEMGKTP